jgi:phosphoserine phosphatase
MEADLRIAREVQVATLPVLLPSVTGYDIAAITRPAEETGGDTYDVATIEGGRNPASTLLLMADASGHGVGPAMSVSRVQAMMRMALGLDVPLIKAIERVNSHLHESLPVGRFVAAFAGLLDPAAHTIQYVAAGIAPLLILRADGRVEERDADTYPLGIDARFDLDRASLVSLEPGDSLVILSDGIYELRTKAPGSACFGVGQVIESARRAVSGPAPASAILGAIMRAATAFADGGPLVDDQTGLVVARRV